MKVSRSVWVLVSCALATASFGQAPDLSKMDFVLRSVPDGPIAKVSGVNIAREEFVNLYKTEISALAMAMRSKDIPPEARIDTGLRSLMLLIQREVLYQEALKKKITVSDDEVNKFWGEELDRLKGAFEGDKGKTLSEKEILDLAGLSREHASEQFRKSLIIRKMSEQIVKDKGVMASDAEVKEFFDKNKDKFKRPEMLHLQQVFVNTRPGGVPLDDKKKADARKKIEDALKRVHAGESFESVAKSMSESPDRDRGGDMGPLPVAALPPFFVETAKTMNVGDLSTVLESEFGFHFFKLIEKDEAADVPFEKAKDRIKERMLDQKKTQAVDEFCKEFLMKPGYVEVYLQLEKTLASNPAYKKLMEERSKSPKESGPPAAEAKPDAKSSDAGKSAVPAKTAPATQKSTSKKATKK